MRGGNEDRAEGWDCWMEAPAESLEHNVWGLMLVYVLLPSDVGLYGEALISNPQSSGFAILSVR